MKDTVQEFQEYDFFSRMITWMEQAARRRSRIPPLA
jgi:hypothetical protein